ncbi:serrate RNA effector molecule homolog isoform X3 [Haliotis cracherodii]|uniref:serrate RNA effector molecule homolog isoform X3 n=1 Tax=Haliotis cracherodii TaxID=6455 RepID=UPI0039E89814
MPYGGGPMHGGGGHPHHEGTWGPGPDIASIQGPPQQQGGFGNVPNQGRMDVDYPTQPSMMTFKQYLTQQDDNINDQDAIKKYNEYKQEFKKIQINEFFLAHKEEEWFKLKYHPEECEKRQDEVRMALLKRLKVFTELMQQDRLESIMLDIDNTEDIIKVLDAAVIKMEGGSDFDLTILDQPEKEEEVPRSRNNSESHPVEKSSPEEEKKKKAPPPEKIEEEVKKEESSAEPAKEMTITAEQRELQKKAKEFQQLKEKEKHDKELKKAGKKHHRDKSDYNYESGSSSGSISSSESESDDNEPLPPGVDNDGEPLPAGETDIYSLDEDKQEKKVKEDDGEIKDDDTKECRDIDSNKLEEEDPRPKPLHKTVSVFLRNLAPTITKQEVEAVCKRYPGFVRVALQDPQPERRFFRRGWVTFKKNVNIKEICWNLNNIRLRDCELGATLNRELKQRVRPVTGLTAHKQVVKHDIKIAAKIIQNLDDKWRLWEDEEEKKDEEKGIFKMSKNPVLKNITDYLVDEGSFEEEELLGESVEDKEKDANPEVTIERDESLMKVLDKLIFYLRVVHSIDYYSANEYPNEDEMPHRCGIMHCRGMPPGSKFTQSDLNDWIANFENKTKQFTESAEKISNEDATKLGKKDPEAEVEKFVQANTQELAKDKWLCPLSGKKFKGPEFVRKHVFNKHGEKVEEVRKEVSFFNNYLHDPKRPALPEHPGNKQNDSRGGGGGSGQVNSFQGPPQQGMMGGGYNQQGPPMMYGNGPQFTHNFQQRDMYRVDYRRPYRYRAGGQRDDSFGSSRSPRFRNKDREDSLSSSRSPRFRRSDPRSIIEYRDLDAPEEMDL